MDVNKRTFFKKRPNNQFKREGVEIKKIGGVIGKGGNIVKALKEETQAKITVADSVPGLEEGVIFTDSPPTKIYKKQKNDEDSAAETEKEFMESHYAAQDALLEVHDRIIEEDLFSGMASDDDDENNSATARPMF